MRSFSLRTCLIVSACCILACYNFVSSRDNLSPKDLRYLERAEKHYAQQAIKKAKFISGCKDEAKTSVQEQRKGATVLAPGLVYEGPVATSIGVEACGGRSIYNVVCDALYVERNGDFLCAVTLEGTSGEQALRDSIEKKQKAAAQD